MIRGGQRGKPVTWRGLAGWLNVPGGLGGNCLGLRKAAGGSREPRAERGPVLKVGAGQREPWSKASLRGFPRGELFWVSGRGSWQPFFGGAGGRALALSLSFWTGSLAGPPADELEPGGP